jgi:type VI secretion system protein ImpL
LGNCFETARPATPATTAGDFFRDRERTLRDRLYRQCFAIVGKQAAKAYGEVQSFFTQRIAGKFPFADGISDIYPSVAEPETLREFFKAYDKNKEIILGVPADTPSFGTNGPAIHKFINDLANVRVFLAPFLDNTEPGALPVLDFEVEFRVNRQAEVGGDQVIEWRLEIGERELVHPPPDPVVRWTYGDRVRLKLRWADGSVWQPVKGQEAQALEIDGKSATFTYENPWSLVSFMQDYPTVKSDFLTLLDEKPRTLKFILAMERSEKNPDMRKLTEEELTSESRVFIRVSLIAPDSKEPIHLPTFPKQAPRLPL